MPLVVALSLGAAACGSRTGSEVVSRENVEPSISVSYLEDGTRYTETRSGNFTSFCDGNDLVDAYNGRNGGGISRTFNHPACEDGKLTPEDF